MKIIKLESDNENEIIEEAAFVLQRGGSVVYPTDTVYGLGVNPFEDFSVRRLFRIKKRPQQKPIPLIVRSISMAKKLAYIDSKREKILKAIWPGAVSVVLYKRKIISDEISAGTNTVSLRIPDYKFCAKLICAFNSPITSTSINISGEAPTRDPRAVIKRFNKELYKPDLMIDAGLLHAQKPSTVLDLAHPKPKVLRVGPVSPEELKKLLMV